MVRFAGIHSGDCCQGANITEIPRIAHELAKQSRPGHATLETTNRTTTSTSSSSHVFSYSPSSHVLSDQKEILLPIISFFSAEAASAGERIMIQKNPKAPEKQPKPPFGNSLGLQGYSDPKMGAGSDYPIVQARTHLLAVLPALSLYAVAFIVLFAMALYFRFEFGSEELLLQLMVNTIAIVVGAGFILTFVDWKLRVVEIAPHQITVRRGWLGWRQDIFQLKTATVHLEQPVWEHLVDMGTLVVMAVNREEMRLSHLNNFDAIRRVFEYAAVARHEAWVWM